MNAAGAAPGDSMALRQTHHYHKRSFRNVMLLRRDLDEVVTTLQRSGYRLERMTFGDYDVDALDDLDSHPEECVSSFCITARHGDDDFGIEAAMNKTRAHVESGSAS